MSHSQTPWTVGWSNRPGQVRDANGNPVFEASPEISAFIVKAVNAYESLIIDAKANAEWFHNHGYDTEAANIRKMISKAEAK